MARSTISPHEDPVAHQASADSWGSTLAAEEGSSDPTLESFVTGYASVGVQLVTPRAVTALRASRAFLNESQHPGALAFVESKGTLEGLYAKLYHRRDRLWMKYDRRSHAWSLKLAQDVAIDSLVADILAHHELSVHEATAADRQRDQTKQTVLAALLLAMSLYSDLASTARSMVAAASAEGIALGQTVAASLLAFIGGHKQPDMDTLQAETLKQLQQAHDYWDNVDTVVNQMLEGLAGDVAKSMSKLIAAGATQEQLVSYVTSVLGSGAGAAFYIDSHIHALFALAALAAYTQAGTLVDFVTVGDERVCPMCFANEAGNPYKPDEVPGIPYHGGCRCWYAPAT